MKVTNGQLGGGVTERPLCERCSKENAIRAIPLSSSEMRVLCNPCWETEMEERKTKEIEKYVAPIIEKILDEKLAKFVEKIKNDE